MSTSTSNHPLPILIVGGGPTGLVLALALLRSRIDVRLIERSSVPHEGIRGTAITPRTLELLSLLQAADNVLAVATPPLLMAIYGDDGKTLLKELKWSPDADDSPAIPYRHIASISQTQLEKVLRKHVEKLGGKIELGLQLLDIPKNSQQGVTARVKSEDGTEFTIDCAYLLAADGAKGRIRRLLGLSFLGETNDSERMFTANALVPGIDRDHWHRWGDFAKTAVALKPLYPAPLFHLQALGPTLPETLPDDTKGVQSLFNSVAHRDDLIIEEASYVSEWRANIRMVDKFCVGRVYLAGDSAHVHSPAGGQGTNTAMQDAINLAWKLALVHKGLSPPSLLETYETERMPVVAEMLNLTTQLHERAFNRIPSTARSSPTEDPIDPMSRPLNLLQLGINYRWSPIVVEGRDKAEARGHQDPHGVAGGELRAGDRAPDATDLSVRGKDEGGATTSPPVAHHTMYGLVAAAKGKHVILIFPASLEDVRGSVEGLRGYVQSGVAEALVVLEPGMREAVGGVEAYGARVCVDESGHARTGYGVETGSTAIVVVRPDGIIGAYVLGIDQAHEYFSRILYV